MLLEGKLYEYRRVGFPSSLMLSQQGPAQRNCLMIYLFSHVIVVLCLLACLLAHSLSFKEFKNA